MRGTGRGAVRGAVGCAERHRTSTLPRPFAKQAWAIGLRIRGLAVGAGLRSARDRHGAIKGGRGSYTKRQGVLCCAVPWGGAWLRRRRRRRGRGAAEAARVLSVVPSAGCGVRCIPQKRLAINRHVRAGAAQLLTAGWPPGGSDACLSIGQCFLHWVRVFGCGWVLGGRAG